MEKPVLDRLMENIRRGPTIDPRAWVARNAILEGDVRLAPLVSVWPGAILRADLRSIVVGSRSNLQDGVIVHLADEYGVEIGEEVTVGHGAILHACRVGDGCLIGMRATILDGALIGRESIVGAHALVTGGTEVPEGSMVLGAPAKVVRELSKEERQKIRDMAAKYVQVSEVYAGLGKVWRTGRRKAED